MMAQSTFQPLLKALLALQTVDDFLFGDQLWPEAVLFNLSRVISASTCQAAHNCKRCTTQ